MNIIPRFIVRRFLPGYLAGFFGYLIYLGSNGLSHATQPMSLSIALLVGGIFGFLGMLSWAYKLDQLNP